SVRNAAQAGDVLEGEEKDREKLLEDELFLLGGGIFEIDPEDIGSAQLFALAPQFLSRYPGAAVLLYVPAIQGDHASFRGTLPGERGCYGFTVIHIGDDHASSPLACRTRT